MSEQRVRIVKSLYQNKLLQKYFKADDEDSRLIFTGGGEPNMLFNENWPILARRINNHDFCSYMQKTSFQKLQRLHILAEERLEDDYIDTFSEDFVNKIGENIRRKTRGGLRVVGAGGYMANLLYIYGLFIDASGEGNNNEIVIYDDDFFELDNLCRIMAPVWKKGTLIQSDVGGEVIMGLPKAETIARLLNSLGFYEAWYSNTRFHYHDHMEDDIIIGSPDIVTRTKLEQENARFFFFGHHGNESVIIYSPTQESDVAIETYGKIDVRAFWASVYVTALKFLEMDWDGEYRKGQLLHKSTYKIGKVGGYDIA
jgi:hypothetical protein